MGKENEDGQQKQEQKQEEIRIVKTGADAGTGKTQPKPVCVYSEPEAFR